ncbi:MAG: RNA polymerase sigma factor [Candidatus Schekmanbacteria bacterium]|nr:RNA polymerase sigma factor [Candidatus Schekmanbacteria bacterium]
MLTALVLAARLARAAEKAFVHSFFGPVLALQVTGQCRAEPFFPAAAQDTMVSTEASDVENADLVAALEGDGEAYRRIVERHQGMIAGLMRRFTRNEHLLEELVQDVFVETYMSLGSFAVGRPLSPWLRAIAIRVGYRFWQTRAKDRKQVPIEAIEDVPDQDAGRCRQQAAETLTHLFARLSNRDRLVLTLMYLEGCTVKEIAESAGWSLTMTRVQAHRARERLRKLVERSAAE